MIAWTCLAFLSVAAAAPQLQLQQPLRSQIISASQLPLTSQIQTIPLNTQSVQQVPITYQTSQYQALPINYQAVQPQYAYQSLPINYQQLPVQQIRVSQIKPVTQLRTQTIKSALPVIQSTVAPLAVQQRVVPQIQSVAIQQRVIPQIQNLALQPKIQTLTPQLQGVNILRQVQQENLGDGVYAFAYETENGIKAQEEGRTINQGTDAESSVVQGSYSYVAPDGTPITVNYIADENGFRAEGEHIPKPSEEIQRSVDYLRSLPPRPEDQEGKYVPQKK